MNKEAPLRMALVVLILFFALFIALQRTFNEKGVPYETLVKDEIFGEEGGSGIFGFSFTSFKNVLNKTGLSERGFCPFINPYMSELFAAGSIEVSSPRGGNSLYHALFFVRYDDKYRSCFNTHYGKDDAASLAGECITKVCDAPISAIYNYDAEAFDVACGTEEGIQVSVKDMSAKLNQSVLYLKNLGISDFGLSVNDTMPGWQCFFFFGILPFFAMYFFLLDILGFTMLSPKLKLLLTFFASTLAVFTGGFAKFVWQLSYLAVLGVQGTFLMVMVVLSMISLILSWIGSIGAGVGDMYQQSAELGVGMAEKYTFRALSRAVEKGKKGK